MRTETIGGGILCTSITSWWTCCWMMGSCTIRSTFCWTTTGAWTIFSTVCCTMGTCSWTMALVSTCCCTIGTGCWTIFSKVFVTTAGGGGGGGRCTTFSTWCALLILEVTVRWCTSSRWTSGECAGERWRISWWTTVSVGRQIRAGHGATTRRLHWRPERPQSSEALYGSWRAEVENVS